MHKEIIITCKDFRLRKWLMKDIKSLVENANNRKVWINLKDVFPYPYSPEEARRWIELTRKMPLNTNFAIEIDGAAVGGIGVHFFEDVHKHSAEIGYWLGENHWGRGIATEAVGTISRFVFENFDINRIFARVFEWNTASMKVLEKNNFIYEGRLRKHIFKDNMYTDEIVYGLLKDENRG